MLVLSYAAGSIPFSYVAASVTAGVDLRRHGTGTVSGTGLYEVSGFVPLALAGIPEVVKGGVGPWLAHDDDLLAAVAAGVAVAAHNWSPWLRGAGGRGISPALGALAVTAPEGAVLLLAGMVAGRFAGETAIGALVSYALLVPVCARRRGRAGALAAGAVLAPMLLKRLTGNARATSASAYFWRLLLDRDTPHK